MSEGQRRGGEVVENWEEAGDETVDAQLEQRRKLLAKKQMMEEKERLARSTIINPPSTSSSLLDGDQQPAFRILRRPQSSSTLSPAGSGEAEKARIRSLEERQAAYQQARERIFGDNYNPDQEPPPVLPEPPTHPSPPFEMLRMPTQRMPLNGVSVIYTEPMFDASRPPPHLLPNQRPGIMIDPHCPPYGCPPVHLMSTPQHFTSMNSSSNPHF